MYIIDENGDRYLDLLSGIGVNALGYNASGDRREPSPSQSRALIHTSNLYYHEGQAELAMRLTERTGLDRVFFANTGTEAWEGALKLARAYAGLRRSEGANIGTKFLALEQSFHGRTFGSMSTTYKEKYREPFAPVVPGVEFVRFNDVADLRAKFSSEVCAILVEAIQGEGGVRPLTQEFFAEARALASSTGALLIVDEIQAGMGRTGKWCAYQHYGIQPDVTTLAKPLAGGIPLGAVLCTEEVARAIHAGMHGTTFGGGPLACAVGHRRHRHHREGRPAGARHRSRRLLPGAACARSPQGTTAIIDVRGKGLMLAAELDSADLAKLAVAEMLKRRILINCTSDTVLRFLPPYILERAHVDTADCRARRNSSPNTPRAQHAPPSRRTPSWLAEPPWNSKEPAVPVQKDPDVLAAAARMAGEDLCSIADLSSAEVRAILKLGHDVKRNPREYRHALDAKQMVLMFEKASLRTRLAFETGINTMGGNAIFVDQTNSPLGERETIADVARNLERWVDVIVLRTYAHDTITEMAANSRVPVINALSDFEHPCQALADFMTLEEHFGTAAGLNFTYVGDGNNVCHSLMLTGAQLGANVTVATPRGYSPDIEIVTMAREIAETNGCEIRLLQDPQAAVEGADAVYTDVCVSMGFEHESTKRAPIFRPVPGE